MHKLNSHAIITLIIVPIKKKMLHLFIKNMLQSSRG